MLRHLGLLALAALPVVGCAKGEEIAPGEVVIFTLEPDAGADAGSRPAAGNMAASPAPDAGGTSAMGTASPPPMAAGQPSGNIGNTSPTDAGTNDAGQSEDRPVDAGS